MLSLSLLMDDGKPKGCCERYDSCSDRMNEERCSSIITNTNTFNRWHRGKSCTEIPSCND